MAIRRLAPAEIQPATFAFTEENERWLEKQVAKYPDGRQASAVIPALWQAQKQNGGWLPQKAIEAVAARLGMPLIRVLEVATFYTMFNLEPVGRYFIQLCGTVPCHVKGALDLKQVLLDRVGDPHHVTTDGYFSWIEVECLGACCNAPMVQINDDYFEDLTPDLLIKLLDDLKAGREVKPGPQNGRVSSEPKDEVKTLTDPALYDGSVVGSWRARFKDELSGAPSVATTGEHQAATATGPGDPKAAKPDAGRPIERPVADTPASRSAAGETPVKPADQADAARSDSTGAVYPGPETSTRPQQSDKSYTVTPSKPEEGRVAADAKGTTPVAGTPPSETADRRDGSDTKPVGSSPDVSPGVAPKE
ncbi:NADH-quinone oxidoreductase subunit NuoE [Enterovirga aerilata]|uniref:NADH-quinone oxidoreductase subunit NuoE n=1 Tax=Enterovirga aerilata TaxID=2730920 RepID=A0A849I4U8_9HYPH|nr:NADH-quinone oxidoreductase subunit NuoE [Enterovirga sp. DB1703]NNM72351.1 NADH-quinone oxidoreductase subunit NuoE [Enterovirga sp. DB1703]